VFALAMTGWGFETEPMDQVQRDAPQLLVCALAGAAAGALILWVCFGARRLALLAGAGLGFVPALVMVSAYFTDAY
jgi:hypothetical protein